MEQINKEHKGNKEEQQKYKQLAIIFIVTLLILSITGLIISIPTGKTINIYEEGIKAVESNTSGKYYKLDSHSYKVLNNFDNYITTNSTFQTTEEYEYFNVLVTDSTGKKFIMAVRTDAKTQQLNRGNPVDLYGMISPLKNNIKNKQLESLQEDNEVKIISKCLNDNDSIPTTNGGNIELTLVSLILFIISTLSLIKVKGNKNDNSNMY